MRTSGSVHYLRRNFDSAAIVAALATAALTDDTDTLTQKDHAVLAALRRANNALRDAPLADVRYYLRGLDEAQVPGLVSNVKGILHEMEFVRVENADGDSVYASFFDATNHPDTDIHLIDRATGETWEAQLKATDDASCVADWLDAHPGGDILVTDELARRLDLPTSGQSNGEITADVEEFVDRMLAAADADGLWDYVPVLGLASVALVVWELHDRHRRGDIDWATFKRLATRATGLKIAKIGALGLLLSVPGIGQVTGAVLVARLLLGATATWHERSPIPPRVLRTGTRHR